MSDTKRELIPIGGVGIEGFQLPDGSYRMSQAQAAQAIGESPVYALRFLAAKDSKVLLGERYTDYTPEQIEVKTGEGKRGQSRINALPLHVVSAYWLYRAYRGNKQAFVMCWALLTETLERRFDNAFGVSRSEVDYDQRLSDRVQQLQGSLAQLEEAYAEPDVLREHVARLEQQIRQLGAEPWQPEERDSET